MPIEFRCSECYVLLRTPDDTLGRPAVCPECGAELTVPAPAAEAQRPRSESARPAPAETGRENHAIYGMVLGAAAIGFSCCFPIGLPCAVAGFVLGILGLNSARRRLAVLGIFLSLLGGALTFLALGFIPWMLGIDL